MLRLYRIIMIRVSVCITRVCCWFVGVSGGTPTNRDTNEQNLKSRSIHCITIHAMTRNPGELL
jgi:hypothetical protein